MWRGSECETDPKPPICWNGCVRTGGRYVSNYRRFKRPLKDTPTEWLTDRCGNAQRQYFFAAQTLRRQLPAISQWPLPPCLPSSPKNPFSFLLIFSRNVELGGLIWAQRVLLQCGGDAGRTRRAPGGCRYLRLILHPNMCYRGAGGGGGTFPCNCN